MCEQPSRSALKTMEVLLDGRGAIACTERRSLSAIRTYLETLALENERILCTFSVDGRPANIPQTHLERFAFYRIEGQTMGLTDMPLRMLRPPLGKPPSPRRDRNRCHRGLDQQRAVAWELWWDMARKLKEPLLTLSLLPENIYQPVVGCASLLQMRKWQPSNSPPSSATWMKPAGRPPPMRCPTHSKIALPRSTSCNKQIRLWYQTVLCRQPSPFRLGSGHREVLLITFQQVGRAVLCPPRIHRGDLTPQSPLTRAACRPPVNVVANHTRTISSASSTESSVPRWPARSASLCSRDQRAVSRLQHNAQRTPHLVRHDRFTIPRTTGAQCPAHTDHAPPLPPPGG